jgi:hypothetical protein
MFSDLGDGKFYNSAIILTSVHVTTKLKRTLHWKRLQTENTLSAFRHKVAQNSASGVVDGVRRLPRRWQGTTGTALKVKYMRESFMHIYSVHHS